MKAVTLALLLLMPGVSLAQGYEGSLEPISGKLDYLTIEFMSVAPGDLLPSHGDGEGLPPATPRERALRVVIYRSEIYQDLVIETITTGLEGCCVRLASSGRISLAPFAAYFGFKGEASGIHFVEWSSPRSFTFTYKGVPFRATVFESGAVSIDRETGANSSFKPKPLRGSA
jgi:hypothetical protein